MTSRIQLILGLAAMIVVLALVGGTATHQVIRTSGHSPYLSALANVSVGTAEAAGGGHKCQNRSCDVIQGIQSCFNENVGTNCAIVNGVCSGTACR
jgi:hypothetical protein